jgi:NMD protein affecting ribosome stability and mRNA decay
MARYRLGRHAPRWTCVRCGTRRVPSKGSLCFDCSVTDPRLPRPTGAFRHCPRCGSPVAGDRCPACAAVPAGETRGS